MNKLPALTFVCFLLRLLCQESLYAQGTPAKTPATRFDYAVSGSLTVYEKPDITSKVIGQLIYKETIQVVIDSEPTGTNATWVRIVSPYEGYFLQSRPGRGMEGMAAIGKLSTPGRSDKKQGEAAVTKKTDGSEPSQSAQDKVGEEKISATLLPAADSENDSEKNGTSLLIGLGIGGYTVAEEKGYAGSGIPLDLYFEYTDPGAFLSGFRLGVNSSRTKDSDYTIATNSIYLVYRLQINLIKIEDTDLFGIAGPAWMISTLSGNDSQSASGFGMVLGGGAVYRLPGDLQLGGQIVYFTSQQDFDVIKRYVGSTQVQLLMSYAF